MFAKLDDLVHGRFIEIVNVENGVACYYIEIMVVLGEFCDVVASVCDDTVMRAVVCMIMLIAPFVVVPLVSCIRSKPCFKVVAWNDC